MLNSEGIVFITLPLSVYDPFNFNCVLVESESNLATLTLRVFTARRAHTTGTSVKTLLTSEKFIKNILSLRGFFFNARNIAKSENTRPNLTHNEPSDSLVRHWPPTRPDKRVVQYSLNPHSSSLSQPFSLDDKLKHWAK